MIGAWIALIIQQGEVSRWTFTFIQRRIEDEWKIALSAYLRRRLTLTTRIVAYN